MNNIGAFSEFDINSIYSSNKIIKNTISEINTVLPVQVLAVRNSGLNPVGFIDCKPLIMEKNAQTMENLEMPTQYNIPYFRLQGGQNAIIIDPKQGDLGFVVISQRDISRIKEMRAKAESPSLRKYNLSDAIYVGGILNGTPSNYIFFDGNKITINATSDINIVSGGKVDVKASGDVNINAGGKVGISASAIEANCAISCTDVVTGSFSANSHTHTCHDGKETSTGH